MPKTTTTTTPTSTTTTTTRQPPPPTTTHNNDKTYNYSIEDKTAIIHSLNSHFKKRELYNLQYAYEFQTLLRLWMKDKRLD